MDNCQYDMGNYIDYSCILYNNKWHTASYKHFKFLSLSLSLFLAIRSASTLICFCAFFVIFIANMPNTFEISPVNPIRFRKLIELDDRYNNFGVDYRPTESNVVNPYYQPWQVNDNTFIQVLSDYTFTVTVYNAKTGFVAQTITPAAIPTAIVNQTFSVYEFEIDFSDFGIGFYYIDLVYADGTFRSETFEVRNRWENSLLIEYKNSYNAFSVIFDTTISFSYRLLAQFSDFKPDADSEIYVDQDRNTVNLNSVPYRNETLTTYFMPDWALDKLTWILSCDEKKIEGRYYEKIDGSKLDIVRVDGNPYGYGEIELRFIENFFLQQYVSGDMPVSEYILIQKVAQYIDVAADITITGKFKANTHLTRIAFINKGIDTFTMKVGTTAGGNDLGQFDIYSTDLTGSCTINYMFDSSETVYISGLSGTLLNLFVDYKQYDSTDTAGGSSSSSFRFPKGFSGWWKPVAAGDLAAYWDLASGLGKVGTSYENCAIEDGRNGTVNKLGKYSFALSNLSNTATLGNTIGDNNKTLTLANIPPHDHYMFNGDTSSTDLTGGGNSKVPFAKNAGQNRDYVMAQTNTNPDRGKTGLAGGSSGVATAFDIRPSSIIELPFIAITD